MSDDSDYAGSTNRRTVLKALSASGVGVAGVTGMTGSAAAVTDPSDVTASLYSASESSYTQSSYEDALVRIYQTDNHGMSELETVKTDVEDFVDQLTALDGWRVELYETNVTGFLDCMQTDGCDPYLTGREYVYELGHYQDGGGNVFVHPNDDGDTPNEGGTYSAGNNDNYITMPYYNDEDRGPISIKGSDTLDSTCKTRGVYWAICHELGHQFLGLSDWWDSDYGTYYCGDDYGRKSHYLATNTYPCVEAFENSIEHHTIMGQLDWLTDCGECSDSAKAYYASVASSSCFDDATQDCIDYAKNNL